MAQVEVAKRFLLSSTTAADVLVIMYRVATVQSNGTDGFKRNLLIRQASQIKKGCILAGKQVISIKNIKDA